MSHNKTELSGPYGAKGGLMKVTEVAKVYKETRFRLTLPPSLMSGKRARGHLKCTYGYILSWTGPGLVR